MDTNNTPNPAPTNHHKVGPIIATLVILIILVVAALYVFASRMNKNTPVDATPAVTDTSAPTQDTVASADTNSDDPAAMQADLDASTQNVDSKNF